MISNRFLALACLLAPSCALPPSAPRPNVILVMSDDQGWGDTGYNGHPTLRTPNLDAMAASGVRFDRFYAAAPVCSPTRGSCLTGRHPYRYGIRGANVGHMPQHEHTLAEVLRARGYRTGHFGKWHLGTLTKAERDSNRGGPRGAEHYAPPWEHGFDTCFSTEAKVPTFDPMITPPKSAGGVGTQGQGQPYGTAYWTGPGRRVPAEQLRGDDSRLIMDRALPFIEAAVAANTPFLGVIWFHAPHLPVVASAAQRAGYAEVASTSHQHYYACITALDQQVGRLRARLRELGVADHTMLWFCSDNGPEGREARAPGSTRGLRGRKRSLFEGGVRVPGLLEWPDRLKTPRVVTAPCSTLDYLPTVLAATTPDATELTSIADFELDGIDLSPLLLGQVGRRERGLGFESGRWSAWIEDRYKLVRNTRSDGEFDVYLFDLLADPAEQTDLAPREADITARMTRTLRTWQASCKRSSLDERAAARSRAPR